MNKQSQEFLSDLLELMEKHGVDEIGVNIYGDTHGLEEQFFVNRGGKEEILEINTGSCLSRSDIRELITSPAAWVELHPGEKW